MRKLLLLLFLALCVIVWRSGPFLRGPGSATADGTPAAASADSPGAADAAKRDGMSASEFAELAKSDPDAYRKAFRGRPEGEERSELDKLINLFTRLKYE